MGVIAAGCRLGGEIAAVGRGLLDKLSKIKTAKGWTNILATSF